MNFKTILSSAALGVAMLAGGSASAATVAACGIGSGLECLALNGSAYYGPSGDKESFVEAAIADALNLASIDLTLLGKSDGGYGTAGSGQSGTWTVPGAVDYITVKGGNDGYTIYATGGASTGSWTTMGITNGGGNQPNLSHISYWSGGSMAAVPLPAAGMLLLTALGGVAAFGRRKA